MTAIFRGSFLGFYGSSFGLKIKSRLTKGELKMETQVKYTPGPWRAVTFPPEKGISHYVTAAASESLRICITGRWDLASAADARLIASAPRLKAERDRLKAERDALLDACKNTLGNLDHAAENQLITAPRWFQAQLGESAKELRAAIASIDGAHTDDERDEANHNNDLARTTRMK